jgi:hypothetical protein
MGENILLMFGIHQLHLRMDLFPRKLIPACVLLSSRLPCTISKCPSLKSSSSSQKDTITTRRTLRDSFRVCMAGIIVNTLWIYDYMLLFVLFFSFFQTFFSQFSPSKVIIIDQHTHTEKSIDNRNHSTLFG